MSRPARTPPLAPTGLRNRVAWAALSSAVRGLLCVLFRVRRSRVPILPDGALILAPNHRSYLDPLVVASLVNRRPIFMMTAKYYDVRPFHSVYRMARCIVLESEGENRRALREAEEVLARGRALVIFPEGGISPDGSLQPLQPGCAWLARRTGAPVYPVWLSGTREALRRDARRLRLVPVDMSVGAPLRIHDDPPGRAGQAAFTARLHAALRALGREAEAFRRRL